MKLPGYNPIENIFEMKMNDTIDCYHHTVTRVPGGWIYKFIGHQNIEIQFVPFHLEDEKAHKTTP